MKVYSVLQKCSGILNFYLVPASEASRIIPFYTVTKPLNKNETGVSCSTFILSSISRQRDKTKCCLLTGNNRKRRGGGEKAIKVKIAAVHGLSDQDLDVAFRQYSMLSVQVFLQ